MNLKQLFRHRVFPFATLLCLTLGMSTQDTILAQQITRCGTPPLPESFEEWLDPLVREYQLGAPRAAVVTLPVVFHIIHNGEAVGSGPNISVAQIESQLEVLNEDFRKMGAGGNDHPAGADVMFEFCLAGIDRVDRNDQSWSAPPFTKCYVDDNIKPATIWDPTSYVNIWVVPSLTNCDEDENLLGYSTWPEGSGLSGVPSNGGDILNEDGVVAVDNSVGRPPANPNGGPYNLGRTLTHELGHFFGLRHIWGDGDCSNDDFCDDTPNCSDPIYGCTQPGEQCEGAGDRMIENYLDYTDDDCMNIFTNDQNARMQAVIANSPRRMELPDAGTCCPEDFASASVTTDYNGFGVSCFGETDGSITVSTSGGTGPYTYEWDSNARNSGTATVDNLGAGTYTVTVTDANGCYTETSVTISEPPLLTASAMVTSDYNGWDISCFGAMDGTASVQGSGGVSPYGYSWSNGQNTQMATGLGATTYTVTVTDANGCSETTSVTLIQPDPLTIEAGPNQTVYFGYPPAACATIGWSGAGGGVPPYSVEWSDGGDDTHEVCPEVTTTYTVTITDVNGCTETDDVLICAIDVRCGNNLNKVEICHHPPDNPTNTQTLCVGLNSVEDHLLHGDILAACGTDHGCPPGVAALKVNPELSNNQTLSIEARPNPFSHETVIRFMALEDSRGSINIVNVTGQVVEEIYQGDLEGDIIHTYTLNRESLPGGVYFCVMRLEDGSQEYLKLLLID